jgi:hypothetical protein
MERKIPMTPDEKKISGAKDEDAFYYESICIHFYFQNDILSKFTIYKITTN